MKPRGVACAPGSVAPPRGGWDPAGVGGAGRRSAIQMVAATRAIATSANTTNGTRASEGCGGAVFTAGPGATPTSAGVARSGLAVGAGKVDCAGAALGGAVGGASTVGGRAMGVAAIAGATVGGDGGAGAEASAAAVGDG